MPAKRRRSRQIKIETFNFTRYGLIEGKVLDVSRDAVTDKPDRAKPRGSSQDNGDSANPDEQSGSAGYVAHVALGSTSMLTEGGPGGTRSGDERHG